MPPKKRDSEGGDHTQVKRRKKKNGNVDDSDDSDVGPDGAAPNNDEYDENKGDGFDIVSLGGQAHPRWCQSRIRTYHDVSDYLRKR